jgi:hypothetical protein
MLTAAQATLQQVHIAVHRCSGTHAHFRAYGVLQNTCTRSRDVLALQTSTTWTKIHRYIHTLLCSTYTPGTSKIWRDVEKCQPFQHLAAQTDHSQHTQTLSTGQRSVKTACVQIKYTSAIGQHFSDQGRTVGSQELLLDNSVAHAQGKSMRSTTVA